jgi:hypothetical protein
MADLDRAFAIERGEAEIINADVTDVVVEKEKNEEGGRGGGAVVISSLPAKSGEVEKLRAQAARLRLEADRRQVELTLEKIAKLTARLETLNYRSRSSEGDGDGGETRNADYDKDRRSLEEELGRLTSQLVVPDDGGVGKVGIASNASGSSSSTPAIVGSATAANTTTNATADARRPRPPPSEADVDERMRRYRDAPEFVRLLVARAVGFDVDGSRPGAVDLLDDADVIRRTFDDDYDSDVLNYDGTRTGTTAAREAIERAYRRSSGDDIHDDENAMPVFTKEQIMAKEKELEDIPKFLKNMVTDNMTELATSLLEDEWLDERKQTKKRGGGMRGGFFGLFGRGVSGDAVDDGESVDRGEIGGDGERMDLGGARGTFGRLFSNDSSNGTLYGGMPMSEVDFMMNSLYPKSTRKEGETPDKKTVDAFLNDVVSPTKAFAPNSNPISVSGGWVSPILPSIEPFRLKALRSHITVASDSLFIRSCVVVVVVRIDNSRQE